MIAHKHNYSKLCQVQDKNATVSDLLTIIMPLIRTAITIFLLVRKYWRRFPKGTNSVMRDSGSCSVTQPTIDTMWGFWPSDTFFIISISSRKSRLSLPLAEAE